jgi:hypothetical protein
MGVTLFVSFFLLVVVGVPIAIALGLSTLVSLFLHHVPAHGPVQKPTGA